MQIPSLARDSGIKIVFPPFNPYPEMTTNVNFFIVGVHHSYAAAKPRIAYVEVLKVVNGQVFTQEYSFIKAEQVISDIKNGIVYHTATLHQGVPKDSAKVILVSGEEEYFTTENGADPALALENLPKVLIPVVLAFAA
jgi:hypothetical protein